MPTKRRSGKLDRFNGPPSGDFQVNQDLANSLGLIAWYPAAGLFNSQWVHDRISNRPILISDPADSRAVSWKVDPEHGVEILFSDSPGPDTYHQGWTGNANWIAEKPCTMMVWVRPSTASDLGAYFSINGGDGDATTNRFWVGSSPSGYCTARYIGDTPVDTVTVLSSTEVYLIVARANDTSLGGGVDLWLNGEYITKDGTNTANLSTATGISIMDGQYTGNGGFFEGGIFTRGLTDAEIKSLYLNRWDLYEPIYPIFYSIPGTVAPVKRTRHTLRGGWPY